MHQFNGGQPLGKIELLLRSCLKQPIATRQVSIVFENRQLRIEDNQVCNASGGNDQNRLRVALGTQRSCGAVVIPRLADGRIVLVARYRYAAGKWSVELPRGLSQAKDEGWKQAAMRCLLDDVGLVALRMRLLGSFQIEPGLISSETVAVLADGCAQAEAPSGSRQLIAGSTAVNDHELEQLVRAGTIDCGLTLAALSLYRVRAVAR